MTLALGIGGASLVGGLIDGLVLKPFGYPDADRLVSVGVTFPRVSDRQRFVEAISPLEAEDIASLRSLHQVVAFDLGNRNISGGDVPDRVFTAMVLGDPFPTMGMPPMVGRGFSREELAPWRPTRGGHQPPCLAQPLRWRPCHPGSRHHGQRRTDTRGGRDAARAAADWDRLVAAACGEPVELATDRAPVHGARAPGARTPRAQRPTPSCPRWPPARLPITPRSFATTKAGGWPCRRGPRCSPGSCDRPRNCWPSRWPSCCSSSAPTSRVSRSRACRPVSASWPFAWRLAQAGGASRASSSPKALVLTLTGGALGLAVAAAGLRGATALLPDHVTMLGHLAGVFRPGAGGWPGPVPVDGAGHRGGAVDDDRPHQFRRLAQGRCAWRHARAAVLSRPPVAGGRGDCRGAGPAGRCRADGPHAWSTAAPGPWRQHGQRAHDAADPAAPRNTRTRRSPDSSPTSCRASTPRRASSAPRWPRSSRPRCSHPRDSGSSGASRPTASPMPMRRSPARMRWTCSGFRYVRGDVCPRPTGPVHRWWSWSTSRLRSATSLTPPRSGSES